MKRFFTIITVVFAFLFAHTANAQDSGKKDKRKDKKEAADTTSSEPAEITIDDAGTSRNNTHHAQSNKTSADSTAAPSGLERPKEEAEEPKEAPQSANEPAKAEENTSDAPAPPPGAGSLEGGAGITIDDAGTQKVKKPADAVNDAMNGGAAPQNLTIDDAGTQRKKPAATTAKMTNDNAPDSAQTNTQAQPQPAQSEGDQVKEQVKEEVKDAAKDKAKEEGKKAGGKALDMIRPKNS